MIEELRGRFLARFVETTRARLARARADLDRGDAEAVSRELHALAGEAQMLELSAVAEEVARGEAAARGWTRTSGDASRAACISSLDAVTAKVAALVVPSERTSEPCPP